MPEFIDISVIEEVIGRLSDMSVVNCSTIEDLSRVLQINDSIQQMFQIHSISQNILTRLQSSQSNTIDLNKRLETFVKALKDLQAQTVSQASQTGALFRRYESIIDFVNEFEKQSERYVSSCRGINIRLEHFVILPQFVFIKSDLKKTIQALLCEINKYKWVIKPYFRSLLITSREEFRRNHAYSPILGKIIAIIFLLLGIIAGIYILSGVFNALGDLNRWHGAGWFQIIFSFLYILYIYSNICWVYNPLWVISLNHFLEFRLSIAHPLEIVEILNSCNPRQILSFLFRQLLFIPAVSRRVMETQDYVSQRLQSATSTRDVSRREIQFSFQYIYNTVEQLIFRTGNSQIDAIATSIFRRILQMNPFGIHTTSSVGETIERTTSSSETHIIRPAITYPASPITDDADWILIDDR